MGLKELCYKKRICRYSVEDEKQTKLIIDCLDKAFASLICIDFLVRKIMRKYNCIRMV